MTATSVALSSRLEMFVSPRPRLSTAKGKRKLPVEDRLYGPCTHSYIYIFIDIYIIFDGRRRELSFLFSPKTICCWKVLGNIFFSLLLVREIVTEKENLDDTEKEEEEGKPCRWLLCVVSEWMKRFTVTQKASSSLSSLMHAYGQQWINEENGMHLPQEWAGRTRMNENDRWKLDTPNAIYGALTAGWLVELVVSRRRLYQHFPLKTSFHHLSFHFHCSVHFGASFLYDRTGFFLFFSLPVSLFVCLFFFLSSDRAVEFWPGRRNIGMRESCYIELMHTLDSLQTPPISSSTCSCACRSCFIYSLSLYIFHLELKRRI